MQFLILTAKIAISIYATNTIKILIKALKKGKQYMYFCHNKNK